MADAGSDAGAATTTDLGALWVESRPVALRYARSLVWDQQLTEDLVSEAFTRVATAADSGRVDASRSGRGYLQAAGRSVCVDELRRRGVKSRPVPLPGAPAGPEDAALDQIDGERVLAALAELRERHRTVLWLLDVEQLPVAEAAVVCGVSVNACHQLLHRARAALRTQYVELIAPSRGPVCDEVARELALGGTLSPAAKGHVERCPVCQDRRDELAGLGVRFPAVLVGLASTVHQVDGRQLRPRSRARSWAAGGVAAATAVVAASAAAMSLRADDHEPPSLSPSGAPTDVAQVPDDDRPPPADAALPEGDNGGHGRNASPSGRAGPGRSVAPYDGDDFDGPAAHRAEVLSVAPGPETELAIPLPLVSATVSVGRDELGIQVPPLPPVPPLVRADVVGSNEVRVEVTLLPGH